MTSPALSLPAGRELASLAREFGLQPPDTFYLGHLLFHDVEAPVYVRGRTRLTAALLGVLHALALVEPASAARLDELLCIGTPLVEQLLLELADLGMAARRSVGAWQTAPLGKQAAASGEGDCALVERRRFHFLEMGEGRHRFATPPVELLFPVPNPGPWHFSVQVLEACLAKGEDARRVLGFPVDVLGLAGGAGAGSRLDRLIVDRAEALAVAVVGAGAWRAWGLDGRSWRRARPAPDWLTASEAEARTAFALPDPPTPSSCQNAFIDWCGRRGVAERESTTAELQLNGSDLRLAGPGPLLDRLRRAPLEPENWLLIGTSSLRRAARVTLS